jgi:hypothetical protein
MKRLDRLLGALAALALVAFTGCANVSPTQRSTLAKPDMQFDFDRGCTALMQHTYASKEGSTGGRGVGGGGCGCT